MPPPLYADDMSLVSMASEGLQSQLDLLGACCDQWGLTVNVTKTKVVIFRPPRSHPVLCTVIYKGPPLEVVKLFKHLGADLHESQRMSSGAAVRAESGQRATYLLLQRCKGTKKAVHGGGQSKKARVPVLMAIHHDRQHQQSEQLEKQHRVINMPLLAPLQQQVRGSLA